MSRASVLCLITAFASIAPPVLAQTLSCELASPPLNVCEAPAQRIYRHPLSAALHAPGRVPLIDVFDNAGGDRFGWVDGGEQEGSTLRLQRGVSALSRSPIPGHVPSSRPPIPAFVRGRLAEVLTSTPSTTGLPLVVHFHRTPEPKLGLLLARALATGEVSTVEDREALRRTLLARRRSENEAFVGRLRASVERAGFIVTHSCGRRPCVHAYGPAGRVSRLLRLPEVRSVGLVVGAGRTHADLGETGTDVARRTQIQSFYDYDYVEGGSVYNLDGENGQALDLTSVIFEPSGFRQTHYAFMDGAGLGPRVRQSVVCSGSNCGALSGSFPGTPGDWFHGTLVAGAHMADMTDDQHPLFSGPLSATERSDRSFGAREGRTYLYDFDYGHHEAAYDHVLSQPVQPHVSVNANGSDDPDCSAVHYDWAESACETLFNHEVAVFASVGNEGDELEGLGDCRVDEPATGLCAMAITASAYAYDPDDEPEPSECRVRRYSSKLGRASPGGQCDGSTTSNVEGYCRSIVDNAVPGCLDKVPANRGDLYTESNLCGTSLAVPLAAGLALDFIDAYKQRFSDTIDDPGILQAWMLQMGDYAYGAINHLLGTGRLKMRMPNEEGLDAPWLFYSVETCVDDGELYRWPVNDPDYSDQVFQPRALSPDVDDLTVSAWFYDREFQLSSRAHKPRVDRFTLRVRDLDTGTVLGKDESQDEKKRVRIRDVGGRRLAVEISGDSVTNDHLGCGNNALRLYMAVLAEDDDRDDADGPSYDAGTCEGVEPMVYPLGE